MENKEDSQQNSFTSTLAFPEFGMAQVPERYILPPTQRPDNTLDLTTTLPVIDISSLHDPSTRHTTLDKIKTACKGLSFFQVINHGISLLVMKEALDAVTKFFNLPVEEKMPLSSCNVCDPVRYGTSINNVNEKVHFWRDFIKHYSHPISNWIHLWPSNPPSYRDKMGTYAKEVQMLQKQLMEAILENLGLEQGYLEEEREEGSQVMVVNCYPACPQPDLALGKPPHADYGTLTILLQSCQGLQIKDQNNNWLSVPFIEGALIVQVGSQVEVMNNGHYKGVVHQVTLSAENKRFSIASIHSLALNKKVGPAEKLVDEEHSPANYEEFSFKDFLDFISHNDIAEKRFIDTLKKTT